MSINSSVINVCNLFNLLWSWESIVPDIFRADSPSLPLVLCMAFPHWLSMLRWNCASLYRWCVRNTKPMVYCLPVWRFCNAFSIKCTVLKFTNCIGTLVWLKDVSNIKYTVYLMFFVTHWDCTMYYTKHCGYINYCPFTALHHPQQHSAAPCPTGENVWVHGW